jgi:PDZ domain
MFLTNHAGIVAWRSGAFAFVMTLALAADASASIPIIPQQNKGESVARARCATCFARRDSVRERQEKLLMRIDSLKHEFEHERLSEAQRETLTDEMRRTIIALQQSMDQVHRANALAMAQQGVEESRASLRAIPEMAVAFDATYRNRGYLGVVFDGTNRDFSRRGERIIQFYSYPRIALVEPSSPAEKAGIQQGDTLVAFNGDDVREREISLTRLLVPNQKLMVRVRRDGYSRDLKVIVGEPPSYVVGRNPRSAGGSVQTGATPAPTWPEPSRAVTPEVVEVQPRSMWIFQEGIAGARVETISEGLGRTVGVSSGILVIRAGPGTPAYESGLRDGDIILSAAGKPVQSVRQLRGVLEGGNESGVKLVIVRERRQRDVTLRW